MISEKVWIPMGSFFMSLGWILPWGSQEELGEGDGLTHGMT